MSEEKRFVLRLDEQLYKQIKQSAIQNQRSIVKEIEQMLFQYSELDPDAEYEEYDTWDIEVERSFSSDKK